MKPKMNRHIPNVLFVIPSGFTGGTEKVMISLINNLPANDISLHLFFVNPEGPLLSDVDRNIPTYLFGNKRLVFSMHQIIRLIRGIKPDFVCSSIYGLNIALLILRPFFPKKTKIIIRESNLPSIALTNEKYPRLISHMIRYFYPKADRIVCLGTAMQNDLVNTFKIPEHKTTIIPNPIDQVQLQEKALIERNPFDTQKFNFLAVGSLRRQKGFDLLIDTMSTVAADCKKCHLTIVGDGQLRTHLSRMIEERGITEFVTLAGYKKNPYPYFYHADQFILSSRSEGLPNAALESLALGTPVIAFDNPGCIHDVITSTTSGKIIHPNTSKQLAKEMLEVVEQPQSSARPDLLPEKYRVHNVITKYEDLFLTT